MDIIESRIDTADPAFRSNAERMQQLVTEHRERIELVRRGGGASYLERHRAQGKMPVRERVEKLLDPSSPFLELSPLAAWEVYDDAVPAAGMVTGIGRVSGREVMIVANDATVKGGTYYPLTVKKHLRAQQVALETGCHVFTSSIRAEHSCRCKQKCFPTGNISGAFFSIRRACRRNASRKLQP